MNKLKLLGALILAASPATAGPVPQCGDPKLQNVMLVALESYKSADACGQAAALAWFNKLFPKGVPKAKGSKEFAAIDAPLLDAAVAALEDRLTDGKAHVVCAGTRGNDDVSGYWNPQNDTMELGPRKMLELAKSSFQAERELRAADDFGNTVTHETFHALDRFFRESGAVPVKELGTLQSKFEYPTFFTGCALWELEGFAGRGKPRIQYEAPTAIYLQETSGPEQAARLAAHAMQLCFGHKVNPYYFEMLGEPSSIATCSH